MRFFLFIILFPTLSFSSLAQKSYFEFQIQYYNGFNSEQKLDYFLIFIDQNVGLPRFAVPNYQLEYADAFSNGFNLAFSHGILIKNNIALETSLNYFKSNTYNSDEFNGNKWDFNSFELNPSIAYQLNLKKISFNPHAGILLGLSKIKFKRHFNDEVTKDFSTNRSFSFGYNAGLKSNFKLNSRTELFIDFGLRKLIYTPKKGSGNEYQTSSNTTIERSFIYYGQSDYNNIEKPSVYNEENIPKLKNQTTTSSFYTGLGLRYNVIITQ
ncbi:outer membrane beta-barrel protein [Marinigracilibium pacificum]|uniref:Porin family protein n=1 Tax=Marinigracilibium pacificum TaxID=2729599 RepID=A0A848IZ34_9BACT|nr:outer membrane beta-barrel protein [Marinigracilibium pacificum]NMM48545.1 porin family protein [Marinigracilibium pacificum]